jgi:predicted enzyme related to lactoylglutathione lyase
LITHFENHGPVPEALVEFYQKVFGWQVEQMPGVNYRRINPGATETKPLHGGLTHSAIPDLNGFLPYVNVASLDETAAKIQNPGGSIERKKTAAPKTAWGTIVAVILAIIPCLLVRGPATRIAYRFIKKRKDSDGQSS